MANLAFPTPDSSPRPSPGVAQALRQNVLMYVLSLSLVAAAFIVRSLLAPTLGDQALYLFLVPPVLIAGVVGGLGPGLLATVVSIAVHLYATGEASNFTRPNSPLFAAAGQ